MRSEILNPRRAPRVRVRCAVEIRQGFATWSGETEDVGPGGCQLVTRRVPPPGREVRLAFRSDLVADAMTVRGRVVWARDESPRRVGVAFDRFEREWFERLLERDPAAAREARSVPDRLPRRTCVYLGKPPSLVVDFSPEELELLRRVEGGATLESLERSFGSELHERTRGALFSLVSRRFLVLDDALAVGVARWRSILPDADEVRPPANKRMAWRPAEAQRLYDEALAHMGAGRLSLAVDRLRDALRLAPADETISGVMKRLARFA